MNNFSECYTAVRNRVLNELSLALNHIDPADLERLKIEVLKAEQVFFIGVGRVFLSLQSVAKRMAHIGISAHCVGEITEPAITARDLLIVASSSGNTLVPLAIAKKAKSIGAMVIHIGSNPESEMRDIAEFMLRIPVQTKLNREDEIKSAQPMTSLFEQSVLLLGDILVQLIIEEKSIDLKWLWQHHANLE
ncbi:MAG: SIS domain-containing protein [Treponema sp.]|jgi:6-phospho-3-hexuloisomerase|nr:SIS domain-containing protein [Treponema sp.]